MTLTTRILLFVLATLAAVLAAFSLSLYLLADRYLHRYAADRAASAMETLRAAVETSSSGLEWEPHERVLRFHQGPFGDDLQWRVTDESGHIVDQSPAEHLLPSESTLHTAAGAVASSTEACLISHTIISASGLRSPPQAVNSRKTARLNLTVGMPLAPINATLNRLALASLAVSVTIWIVVLLIGRALCRTALAPLRRMTASTCAISAETLDSRLPRPATQDELAELGRAFNALLDRLQEAFERQRRFTAEASHQLRTPLTAILGQVDVALRRERSGEEYRRVLSIVRGQGVHLRELIESLLYLSRADSDAQMPDLEPIDLYDWAPKLLAEWNSHPRIADLRWTAKARQACWIKANPSLLAEAVNNLLENAIKYSNPGQPVEVSVNVDNAIASISVADRGDGISVEDQRHLFEPFFRSASARRKGVAGVGLGLAVVARLVKAMGGCIDVNSRHGEGSCFTIAFPTFEITMVEPALTDSCCDIC